MRKLAQELGRLSGDCFVGAELPHELGLQANAKTLEGSSHPDRNAQLSISTPQKENLTLLQSGSTGHLGLRTEGRSWRRLQTRGRELRVKGVKNGNMTSVIPESDGSLRMASTTWARIEDVGIDHDTATLRRGEHPAMVAFDGQTPLSPSPVLC